MALNIDLESILLEKKILSEEDLRKAQFYKDEQGQSLYQILIDQNMVDESTLILLMSEELGINVFGFSCEGYKGVSQSAGHHIANNQLFKHVIGRGEKPSDAKFRINLLGEYNIGGDAFLIEDLLERCGIHLTATFSGNSTYEGFENAQIIASNGLNEKLIQSLKMQDAKISVWGIGTKLVTAYDQPALGAVYK